MEQDHDLHVFTVDGKIIEQKQKVEKVMSLSDMPVYALLRLSLDFTHSTEYYQYKQDVIMIK